MSKGVLSKPQSAKTNVTLFTGSASSKDEPALHFASESTRVHRSAFLDGIRAIAALYVVISHCCQFQGWFDNPPTRGIDSLIAAFFAYGNYAVKVFIWLSGIVLMLPVLRDHGFKRGIIDYYKRRAKRLLPAYYFTLAVCIFLQVTPLGVPNGTAWDYALDISWQSIVSHIFLVHNLCWILVYD